MGIKMILSSLTLVGNRKNYTVKFKKGFNLISGHTSTGKTSILEMIDYALGAKEHKSYIEIGASCSHVELVFEIGKEQYRIRRELFNFKVPVIVEVWDLEKNTYRFFNRYEIDSPTNPKSLSAFLIEKLGLVNITISGQSFSFRDLYKYSYLKQIEIDNEDILGEKSWEKDFKRRATFEIIFNIYDKAIEEYRQNLDKRKEELDVLLTKLSGVEEFINNIDISTSQECRELEKELKNEIEKLNKRLIILKNESVPSSDVVNALRNRINKLKSDIQQTIENKNEQEQYLSKLRLLLNQYKSEVDKKELAMQGYLAFNKYEFLFCPNCLKPIINKNNVETCCLCGSEKGDENSELFVTKKEITVLKRKTTELLKFIEKEDKKYDSLLHHEKQLKRILAEQEIELQHLTNNFVSPYIEEIECVNYEIGKYNRQIFETHKNLSMFEEVERYKELIKSKENSIEIIKNNIKLLRENAINKEDIIKNLSDIFRKILEKFEYPKLGSAYIDGKKYLPYVRDRKYDDLGSLAGVTLITMAYYLSILLVGSMGFNHPGLLIIDSPRKNLGAQAPKSENEDFKDERIFNATIKYLYEISEENKEKVQLIVVNNGFPEFIPKNCVVAEFDSDESNDLPKGFIDDAVN